MINLKATDLKLSFHLGLHNRQIWLFSILLGIVLLTHSTTQAQTTFTSIADGDWTNTTTVWSTDGVNPCFCSPDPDAVDNDIIIIGADTKVQVTTNVNHSQDIITLIIAGHLEFPAGSGQLRFETGTTFELEPGGILSGSGSNSEQLKIGNTSEWNGSDGAFTGPCEVEEGEKFNDPVDADNDGIDDVDSEGNPVIRCSSCDANCVLPVSLVNFDAELSSNQRSIELQWTTATELNNSYFNVEKSTDGSAFNTIGRVDGYGTTDLAQYYFFTDNEVLKGISYYRLKQVDFDGTFAYSHVENVQIDIDINNRAWIDNYRQLRILLNNTPEASIVLYNILGKIVYQEQLSKAVNNPSITIDMNNIQSGMYIVQVVQHGKGIISQKIQVH